MCLLFIHCCVFTLLGFCVHKCACVQYLCQFVCVYGVHINTHTLRIRTLLYTIWAVFALAEFISIKNRHKVPKQYQSWRVEGLGRVTAVHIVISIEGNDYCNMYYQVSRLWPTGNCMKRSCQMKGHAT